jgi:hypothetical protein
MPPAHAKAGVQRRELRNIWTNEEFTPYGLDPVRHNAGLTKERDK